MDKSEANNITNSASTENKATRNASGKFKPYSRTDLG